MIRFIAIILAVFIASPVIAADYFDWRTRTDRDGKPAGIFEVTPFPLTEATTSYSITHDNGVSIFYLGYKVVVDGSISGTSSHNYDPATRTCVGGGTTVYKTITGALAGVTSTGGSATILVRGGVTYTERIVPLGGLNVENPFIVAGYNQERPVINYVNTTGLKGDNVYSSVYCSGAVTHFVLQRFKIQDNWNNGYRSSSDDGYLSVIDVHFYNNDKFDSDGSTTHGDGNLYFLASTNTWVYHCTSERTYGHTYKIGDGTKDSILEWSVADGAGYWSGVSPTTFVHKAVGIDYPNDNDAVNSYGMTARYNIVSNTVNYGLQLRRTRDFSIHHNEFFDCQNMSKFTGDESVGTLGSRINVLIYAGNTSGDFYSNIVRDPGSPCTSDIIVASCDTASKPVRIFNNLIYAGNYTALNIQNDNNAGVSFYNNTVYSGSTNALLYDESGGKEDDFRNNIVWQTGTGSAVDYESGVTSINNCFFAPSGSIGEPLSSGDINQNPLLVSLPSGAWAYGEGNILTTSPAKATGTDLSETFTLDFLGLTRIRWDIGAFAYDYLLWEGTAKQLSPGSKPLTSGSKPMRGL